MRILYAIQGTGNGHISRAIHLIPFFKKKAEVDVLVSGIHSDLELPFEIKYRFHGLGFLFGQKGGVDIWKSLKHFRPLRFILDVFSIPVQDYDLVITDFEPVAAWACKLKGVPVIGLSHQAAFLNPHVPVASGNNFFADLVLRNYAPAKVNFGFHFDCYDDSIFTPIIQESIRKSEPILDDYYTVYLPSYGDDIIIDVLNQFPEINWRVFSKFSDKAYSHGHISVYPIQHQLFMDSLVNCTGVLCGAGFETPAEALFLGKKLMVVPMKNQYEQQCNASALNHMGITVIEEFALDALYKIDAWVKSTKCLRLNYKEQSDTIVDQVLAAYEKMPVRRQQRLEELMDLPVSRIP